jgi:hypothetical protein
MLAMLGMQAGIAMQQARLAGKVGRPTAGPGIAAAMQSERWAALGEMSAVAHDP